MPEIPLTNSQNQDIYNYGFGPSLNRGIENPIQSPTVYDAINEALNAGQVLSGGSLNLKTLSIGSLVRQVAPGDDIQAAIDAVSREGGGTVQLLAREYKLFEDINLKSNVALVGAGPDVTILDFEGRAKGIRATGTANVVLNSFRIADLTVFASGATAGINIQFSNYFRLENTTVTGGLGVGVQIYASQLFSLINVDSTINQTRGFYIYSDASADTFTQNFLLSNCFAGNNGTVGFVLSGTNGNGATEAVRFFTCIQCTAYGNTEEGWSLFGQTAGGPSNLNTGTFVSCYGFENGTIGIDSQASQIIFVSCIANSNTAQGFHLSDDCTLIGCEAIGNSPNFDIDSSEIAMIGTQFDASLDMRDNFSDTSFTDGSFSVSGSNKESPTTERKVWKMQTGTGLRQGYVLVWEPSARGMLATTTITNGDKKVVGMCDLPTTLSSSPSSILIEGFTPSLYANNSGASIAIGDYLSTYSHSYYSKKAIAGEMAFAIALEAPSTGTAQIDALLITPRLI